MNASELSPMTDSEISLLTQALLAFSLLVVTAAAGHLPLAIVKYVQSHGGDPTTRGWMSYLSCFSGGVFLATCFLGVLPHTNAQLDEIKHDYGLSIDFPFAQLFVCCGFFLVYLLEEIVRRAFASHQHGDHSEVATNNFKSDSTEVADAEAEVPIDEEKRDVLRALVFAFAISFHSLLEGFALGVQDTSSGLFSLFFSLLIHKSVEAFSVGIQLSKARKLRVKIFVATIMIYALMTPIGAVIGALIQFTGEKNLGKDATMFVLESIAGGTFIYVTFIEIIAHEKANRFNNIKQLAYVILGFLLIAGLTVFFREQ